jgi:hypothetical protein
VITTAAAAAIAVITTTAAMSPVAVLGLIAAAAVIPSAAAIPEAMAAPAVAITPTGPGAYAQEYAVVEVPRPVIAIGRALIGRIFKETIRASRGRTADVNTDCDSRVSRWRHGQDQPPEQYR